MSGAQAQSESRVPVAILKTRKLGLIRAWIFYIDGEDGRAIAYLKNAAEDPDLYQNHPAIQLSIVIFQIHCTPGSNNLGFTRRGAVARGVKPAVVYLIDGTRNYFRKNGEDAAQYFMDSVFTASGVELTGEAYLAMNRSELENALKLIQEKFPSMNENQILVASWSSFMASAAFHIFLDENEGRLIRNEIEEPLREGYPGCKILDRDLFR